MRGDFFPQLLPPTDQLEFGLSIYEDDPVGGVPGQRLWFRRFAGDEVAIRPSGTDTSGWLDPIGQYPPPTPPFPPYPPPRPLYPGAAVPGSDGISPFVRLFLPGYPNLCYLGFLPDDLLRHRL